MLFVCCLTFDFVALIMYPIFKAIQCINGGLIDLRPTYCGASYCNEGSLFTFPMDILHHNPKVSSLVVSLCGPTIWAQWQKWLGPGTSLLYYSLTTLRCCQTLGEEYTEVVQVIGGRSNSKCKSFFRSPESN